MIVLNQIIIMALLITAGVICYKCGIIGKEATQSLSSLVLMVVNPIVILVSYQQPFEKRMLNGTFMVASACFDKYCYFNCNFKSIYT